jgi:hypothetical protein
MEIAPVNRALIAAGGATPSCTGTTPDLRPAPSDADPGRPLRARRVSG